MSPSSGGASATTRRGSLTGSLGLRELLFSSGAERRLASAVEAGLERVEEMLHEQIAFADPFAETTTRYLLDAGGKRVRPVLVLLAAQLGDGATEDIVRSATALELTHLASLYHDDVMDAAPMRRGIPSAHSVWGNSIAVITGDLLFARASKLLVSLGEDALRLQVTTFERLCLGQLHETVGPAEGEDPIAHYIQVLADKTGSLIATAAESGVRFSGGPAEYIVPLREFGERVGVAFQLADDVLDLSDSLEDTGKAAGTDLRAGVATLPLLRLRELAQHDSGARDLAGRIADAVGPDADPDADLGPLARELREHPAAARTLADAHRYADEAVAALQPVPAGPVKTALTEFARRVVERDG